MAPFMIFGGVLLRSVRGLRLMDALFHRNSRLNGDLTKFSVFMLMQSIQKSRSRTLNRRNRRRRKGLQMAVSPTIRARGGILRNVRARLRMSSFAVRLCMQTRKKMPSGALRSSRRSWLRTIGRGMVNRPFFRGLNRKFTSAT